MCWADICVAMDMPAVWFCANAHELTLHQVSRASAKILCVGFDWDKSMICSLVRSSTYPCASCTGSLLEGGRRYSFRGTKKPFYAHHHRLYARCAEIFRSITTSIILGAGLSAIAYLSVGFWFRKGVSQCCQCQYALRRQT